MFIINLRLRSEEAIQDSVEQSVKKFGGIDIVVNNASAISLTGTQETPMKTYDLMHQVSEIEKKVTERSESQLSLHSRSTHEEPTWCPSAVYPT